MKQALYHTQKVDGCFLVRFCVYNDCALLQSIADMSVPVPVLITHLIIIIIIIVIIIVIIYYYYYYYHYGLFEAYIPHHCYTLTVSRGCHHVVWCLNCTACRASTEPGQRRY